MVRCGRWARRSRPSRWSRGSVRSVSRWTRSREAGLTSNLTSLASGGDECCDRRLPILHAIQGIIEKGKIEGAARSLNFMAKELATAFGKTTQFSDALNQSLRDGEHGRVASDRQSWRVGRSNLTAEQLRAVEGVMGGIIVSGHRAWQEVRRTTQSSRVVGPATANMLIAATLQALWSLQKDFGYAVDDTTQALIDQAVEDGRVGGQASPHCRADADCHPKDRHRHGTACGPDGRDACPAKPRLVPERSISNSARSRTPAIPPPWAAWGRCPISPRLGRVPRIMRPPARRVRRPPSLVWRVGGGPEFDSALRHERNGRHRCAHWSQWWERPLRAAGRSAGTPCRSQASAARYATSDRCRGRCRGAIESKGVLVMSYGTSHALVQCRFGSLGSVAGGGCEAD